jgi:hypothetical protein
MGRYGWEWLDVGKKDFVWRGECGKEGLCRENYAGKRDMVLCECGKEGLGRGKYVGRWDFL